VTPADGASRGEEDRFRISIRFRYRDVSMIQQSFVEVPPQGAAFFVSGPRCAVVLVNRERRIEGDPE